MSNRSWLRFLVLHFSRLLGPWAPTCFVHRRAQSGLIVFSDSINRLLPHRMETKVRYFSPLAYFNAHVFHHRPPPRMLPVCHLSTNQPCCLPLRRATEYSPHALKILLEYRQYDSAGNLRQSQRMSSEGVGGRRETERCVLIDRWDHGLRANL